MPDPIAYLDSLPCPMSAPLQRPERRALSQLPGLRQARPLWTDKAGTIQNLTFVLRSRAQVDTWLAWGRETLHDWGAWFLADWPLPEGGSAVRRFVGVPTYPEWLPTIGGWRVTATVEVRGRSLPPGNFTPIYGDAHFFIQEETEAADGYVLSEANLRATHPGVNNSWRTAQITNWFGEQLYPLTGRRYFEILQRTGGSNMGCAIGFLSHFHASLGTSNPFGVESYMVTTIDPPPGLNPGLIINGVPHANGAFATVPGDVLGVAVNATNGNVFVSVNGTWVLAQDPGLDVNPLFTLPSLDFVAWMTSHDAEIPGDPQSFDGRFVPEDLQFALPTGYIPWARQS